MLNKYPKLRKKLPVIILLILILIFLSVFNPFNKYEIVGMQDFSCSNMFRFTFKYPVFKGWEPIGPARAGSSQGECFIPLSSEYLDKNHINPEVAPQIRVLQRFYHIVDDGNSSYPSYLTETSSNGIHFVTSDSGYDFWTGDSVVSIELYSVHDKYGFSSKKFFETVIKSFQLLDS